MALMRKFNTIPSLYQTLEFHHSSSFLLLNCSSFLMTKSPYLHKCGKWYFTRTGWTRTKEDIKSKIKSAYAMAKLRKSGYSKNWFYKEAVELI
ncbi:hypothetical protein V6N13_020016 [Hibiscus sabdariffa]